MFDEVLHAFGRLNVLVNNAGIAEPTPFDTPDFDDWRRGWQRTIDVNLMSAVHATYFAVRHMGSTGGGKVINVSSRAAFRAEVDAPAYAVSKAGMVNLTRCLARAEARRNILSYCIAPGWVQTDMAKDNLADPSQAAEIVSQIPLGRVATPQDVAGVAAFLASDAANYLTGVTIDVNGGSYLH
jgi:NAD(P)-dependent dehydrogenase (short-subunit alcohol dehydrogenase family)